MTEDRYPNLHAKDHFKYWKHRKYLAIYAVVMSALTTNSFNTSTLFIWALGVLLPIIILFFTSNDGDELAVLEEVILSGWDTIRRRVVRF